MPIRFLRGVSDVRAGLARALPSGPIEAQTIPAGTICVRIVHLASPEEAVREAARRMREADVGTLILVDEKQNPMGERPRRVLRCVAGDRGSDRTPVAERGV